MFLYPAIDLRGGRCVRLRQGDYSQETVFADDPVAVAQRWQSEGADRLHVVDLDGARSGHPVHEEIVRQIVRCGIPVQLGGGLRSEQDIASALDWGVRWVVLGTRALQEPGWFRKVAERWPQRIVLGLDARDGYVATEGWLNVSRCRAVDLLEVLRGAPLAAVVYTDIQRDGMLSGPNETALAEIRDMSSWPVIASGGISTLDDLRRLHRVGVWGCIIGRALYEGSIRLSEALAVVRAAPE
ncbi:1-(5-phosphoribosyl)-5-[(5-phosphoribosylamino)methylideneamino]imidazole-4-carboxamide isomerase [Thermogemmata fonticola]|uniref:1-(5-phosphoribosyl)-5-[(5-phosphoribosylamino)methylideneamino] imidazole-4-carboxamide isomerase n=1 Tax=Thermogemmata fonticola TaxID=2755323 RepID=A0A7V8VAS6_9BACT|nr:1-(5-phosphoribosyl)-5-[(5-phosphoribosylamino)methylideneamino]imidazole-4-carboxamide isomerase [Thermogemmata fonticola]MBA2224629.1 1-(5-phosphoribosyl)-5-[(5-phosphoribosylamino)methylideneamino]imidazole-4-carboxamide isomerase [Thermogemmata fonticola]